MSPELILSALAPSSSPLSPQWHLAVPEVREGAESVLYGVLQLCPNTKHISHLQDAFLCLPFPNVPCFSAPAGQHSLSFKRSFIFRLLILTWLLFVKPIIGRSQLLVNSFSGKSVPAACCAAASMNPRASQLEALVSLSSPLSAILCWVHMVLGMLALQRSVSIYSYDSNFWHQLFITSWCLAGGVREWEQRGLSTMCEARRRQAAVAEIIQ